MAQETKRVEQQAIGIHCDDVKDYVVLMAYGEIGCAWYHKNSTIAKASGGLDRLLAGIFLQLENKRGLGWIGAILVFFFENAIDRGVIKRKLENCKGADCPRVSEYRQKVVSA